MATLTAEAPAGTGEHKPPAKNRERIKRRRGGRIDESGARYFLVKTSVAAARKTVRNSSVSVTFRDGRKLFLGSTGTGAPNPEDFPTENVRKEGK